MTNTNTISKKEAIKAQVTALSERLLFLAKQDEEVRAKKKEDKAEDQNSFLLLNELKDLLIVTNQKQAQCCSKSLIRWDFACHKRVNSLLLTWFDQGLLIDYETTCIENYVSIMFRVNDLKIENKARNYYNYTYDTDFPMLNTYGDNDQQKEEIQRSALDIMLATDL